MSRPAIIDYVLAQQKVDANPTAQTSRKPPNKNINWSVIKKRWLNGDSVSDIAQEENLKRATVYAYADRHRWPKRGSANPHGAVNAALGVSTAKAIEANALAHAQAHGPILSEEAKRHVKQWFDKVLSTAGRIHEQIDERLDRKLEVEELKSLALTLSSVDSTARRTFGLDQPGGPAASPWAAASLARQCPVIDVEPIPAKDAAPYNSHYIQSATNEAAQGQDQAHNPTGPAQ